MSSQEKETPVRRLTTAKLPTKHGHFEVVIYDVDGQPEQPFVFYMGELSEADAPLVRIHSSCFTGDLLASLRCDCGDQLQLALQRIGEEGVGVVVYLHQEGRGIGLAEKIKAYALQDQGMDTVEANLALGHPADLRDYEVAIQILEDLGVSQIRLMSNNPKKVEAFAGSSVSVVEQVAIIPPVKDENRDYLATKRDKMGHVLPSLEQQ